MNNARSKRTAGRDGTAVNPCSSVRGEATARGGGVGFPLLTHQRCGAANMRTSQREELHRAQRSCGGGDFRVLGECDRSRLVLPNSVKLLIKTVAEVLCELAAPLDFLPAHTFCRRSRRSGTPPTTGKARRGRTTAGPSRSKPVIMAPQRESHVGRPSTSRQSCAAPRVRPTCCCSAS
jgi:hypothetical protein